MSTVSDIFYQEINKIIKKKKADNVPSAFFVNYIKSIKLET